MELLQNLEMIDVLKHMEAYHIVNAAIRQVDVFCIQNQIRTAGNNIGTLIVTAERGYE